MRWTCGKSPSISETLDWAKSLVALNAKQLDAVTLENTMSVLLKHESDSQGAAPSANHVGGISVEEDDLSQFRWRDRPQDGSRSPAASMAGRRNAWKNA